MNSYLRKALPVYVFTLTIVGLLLIPSLNNSASAQTCVVTICKSAPELPVPESEDELVFFPFTTSQGEDSGSPELAANSKCLNTIFSGDDFQIVEDFFPGWILDNVECSDASVDVTFIENGVSLDCLSPSEITCTFTNVRGTTATNIPTLSEWGMITAAGGLILIGVFFAVRRRKARIA